MAYNPKIYGSLLADTLPGIIESDKEYARVESVFNALISKGEAHLSPEETRLFGLLANLLEEYESRTLEPLPDLTPLELLASLMEVNSLRQADMTDVFGTQSVVSEVLAGKREITKRQAKALAEKFAMRVEAFI
ncbi:MAG: transcriptional regulator [Acidobacteria bacterium]|nr:transcriptional regulator [Acidobacteriota bacterium]